MRNNTRQKWVDTGYELFAKEGPDGIRIERIARILKRNKSGFYHYFKTPANFTTQLLSYHRDVAYQLADEIQGCESLDPDYFRVVVKFKLFVLVQGQLTRRTNISLYGSVLTDIREITSIPILLLWQKAFSLPNDRELVLKHFSLFQNAFHAQANFDNVTYEFLQEMMIENRDMIHDVFQHQWTENRIVNRLK